MKYVIFIILIAFVISFLLLFLRGLASTIHAKTLQYIQYPTTHPIITLPSGLYPLIVSQVVIRHHLFTIILDTPDHSWHRTHIVLTYSGLYAPISNVHIILVCVFVIIYILFHRDYDTHIVSRVMIRHRFYNITSYTPAHYSHSHIALTDSGISLLLTLLLTRFPHYLTENIFHHCLNPT